MYKVLVSVSVSDSTGLGLGRLGLGLGWTGLGLGLEGLDYITDMRAWWPSGYGFELIIQGWWVPIYMYREFSDNFELQCKHTEFTFLDRTQHKKQNAAKPLQIG